MSAAPSKRDGSITAGASSTPSAAKRPCAGSSGHKRSQYRRQPPAVTFKEAIRLRPDDVSFYRNLALAYQKQGKIAEAEAVMSQVRWLLGDRRKP